MAAARFSASVTARVKSRARTPLEPSATKVHPAARTEEELTAGPAAPACSPPFDDPDDLRCVCRR
eukprot:4787711-Prymnesium_polylepis.1